MEMYAIPSSRRAGTLARKTLPLLRSLGVDDSAIEVWVNPDQADDYADLGVKLRLVDPSGTLTASRNCIARSYPLGTRLVQMDDDVMRVAIGWRGRELVEVTPEQWRAALDFAWETCDRYGLGMWGPYPVYNDYFMRPFATTHLTYATGALWGMTVRGGDTEQVVLDDKEDFERCLRMTLRDGGLLRLAWLTYQTNYYAEPGGMQDYRTPETVEEGARRLAAMFPRLCSYVPPKGERPAEIRLRRVAGVCSPIPAPAWVTG